MNDKLRKLTKRELELIKETELFMEEVYKDPIAANAEVPPDLRERVFKEIRARQAEKAERAREMLCNEDKELLRLVKLYKKQRKVRKYLVLAAVLVFVVAFGITSIGDAEKIFETFKRDVLNREQVQVNSKESIKPVEDLNEEQAYEEIEDKFGFYPVKLDYLPEGIKFIEVDISEEIPRVYMLYGEKEDVKISYIIRPNYRESSWGKDIEDELLEESIIMVDDIEISLKKYRVAESIERWLVGFEYKNTSYSIMVMNSNREEVKKIINGLYFP